MSTPRYTVLRHLGAPQLHALGFLTYDSRLVRNRLGNRTAKEIKDLALELQQKAQGRRSLADALEADAEILTTLAAAMDAESLL